MPADLRRLRGRAELTMWTVLAMLCWATTGAAECEVRPVGGPVTAEDHTDCMAMAAGMVRQEMDRLRGLGLAVNSAMPICQRGAEV